MGGSIKTGLEEEVDLWAMNRRGGLHPNPTYVWTRAHKSPKPSGWFLAVPHNRPPMPFLRPPCPTADESHECRPGLQAAMEEPDWNHDQPRRLPNVENLIILSFKSTQITFVVLELSKMWLTMIVPINGSEDNVKNFHGGSQKPPPPPPL